MSENGKLEDEHIVQAREEGGDDEVRAWSSIIPYDCEETAHRIGMRQP